MNTGAKIHKTEIWSSSDIQQFSLWQSLSPLNLSFLSYKVRVLDQTFNVPPFLRHCLTKTTLKTISRRQDNSVMVCPDNRIYSAVKIEVILQYRWSVIHLCIHPTNFESFYMPGAIFGVRNAENTNIELTLKGERGDSK